jgi:hypothetical protein
MIGAIIARCGPQQPWQGWYEQPAHDAALIVAAINALPELLDRVERLEADMQVIAFGSRIVANADNTLSHVDWTREQLVEFARAALAKDATT